MLRCHSVIFQTTLFFKPVFLHYKSLWNSNVLKVQPWPELWLTSQYLFSWPRYFSALCWHLNSGNDHANPVRVQPPDSLSTEKHIIKAWWSEPDYWVLGCNHILVQWLLRTWAKRRNSMSCASSWLHTAAHQKVPETEIWMRLLLTAFQWHLHLLFFFSTQNSIFIKMQSFIYFF